MNSLLWNVLFTCLLLPILSYAQTLNSTGASWDSSLSISADNDQEQSIGCGPRIRKAWSMLTVQEKTTYLTAIAHAMDDGLYIKFTEIHTDMMSQMEGHGTCMFVYWHRILLLGFENMLRSYGGEFSCILVPYWNYFDENARFLAGMCDSMEDCSPLLQETGGSLQGWPNSAIYINGDAVDGTCVFSPPLNHFCESSFVSGSSCAHCVPRGEWTRTPYPPSTSIISVWNQLFSNPTIESVANNLELGIHNTVHSALGGAMGVLEAPADPIFFSHHASIDLLHTIYHKCTVGESNRLTFEQKVGDARQYGVCDRQSQGSEAFLLATSPVTMRTTSDGPTPLSVFDPQNTLAPYFASLPADYSTVSDVRDMGSLSYNYQITGILADLYANCGDIRALLGLSGSDDIRRLKNEDVTSDLLDAVIIPNHKHKEDSKPSTTWYHDILTATLNVVSPKESNPSPKVFAETMKEVEKMTCMFYEECHGEIQTYSKRFQQDFHTKGLSGCRTIINNIKNGKDSIHVPNWKEIMLRHLICRK